MHEPNLLPNAAQLVYNHHMSYEASLLKKIEALETSVNYWRDKTHKAEGLLNKFATKHVKATAAPKDTDAAKQIKKLTAELDRLRAIIAKFESEIIDKELQQ